MPKQDKARRTEHAAKLELKICASGPIPSGSIGFDSRRKASFFVPLNKKNNPETTKRFWRILLRSSK